MLKYIPLILILVGCNQVKKDVDVYAIEDICFKYENIKECKILIEIKR